jgi:capsular exopolysaccharide synthesis family protein
VESDRALYESVLKTMKETSVTKDIKPMRIRVVQPAFTPRKPFSPRRAMIAALSGLGGIFAGFLLVLCLNFLDSSIKTVDEAETLLRFPVLATVSDLKEVKRKNHPLVVQDDPQSSGAEAFRTLRTSLSMLGRVEDRRVFLFTSSMPAEGKTFCSLNYAASLAQLGLKVLLIDGDLRKPSVELVLMGKEMETAGVTDYLTGRKSFEDVVQPCRLPGLFFISGGTIAPNPAELLAKDGLGELIERALKTYDRVVLDSAPVHAVSDTLLMLKNVQTVCLIIRGARTSTRSIARCVHLLKGAQAPLSGLVLNRMPLRRGIGYGYYKYSPYYDYRYHGKYSKKGVYGA